MFVALRQQVESQGAALEVLGVGTTGYAKDTLQARRWARMRRMVETVAHTRGGAASFCRPRPRSICGRRRAGHQADYCCSDGRVKDFKLNTQCSAGNGYFLQGTAESLGYKVEEYADIAFPPRPCRSSAMAAQCSCSPTL